VSPTAVKVVILGQDPYPTPGNAMGLSFSVRKGVKIPASLNNIFKSLEDCKLEKTFTKPNHGDLTKWAEQGVLLLNSGLTVEKGLPNSHSSLRWKDLTNTIIEIVSKVNSKVVFMLWGNDAIRKKELIDRDRHFVIRSVHPSPMAVNRLDMKTQKKFLRH